MHVYISKQGTKQLFLFVKVLWQIQLNLPRGKVILSEDQFGFGEKKLL